MRFPLRRRTKVTTYLDAVRDAVCEAFSLDDAARTALERALARVAAVGAIPAGFEFICDDPLSANWRLKADPTAAPLGFRLADYRRSGGPVDERAVLLGERLALSRRLL